MITNTDLNTMTLCVRNICTFSVCLMGKTREIGKVRHTMTQIATCSMVLFCRLRRGKLNSYFIVDFSSLHAGERSLFGPSPKYTRDRKRFYIIILYNYVYLYVYGVIILVRREIFCTRKVLVVMTTLAPIHCRQRYETC